jgi:hypothetical protein
MEGDMSRLRGTLTAASLRRTLGTRVPEPGLC